MWQTFVTATTVEQVLELLAQHEQDARIIDGGTDLIIDIEHGRHSPHLVIDASRIRGLDTILAITTRSAPDRHAIRRILFDRSPLARHVRVRNVRARP